MLFSEKTLRSRFANTSFHALSAYQPFKLLLCDLTRFVGILRLPEPSIFQSFVEQNETVAFPQKTFDPIVPPPAEQEQNVLLIRVKIELPFDLAGEPVDPVSQIRVSDCQKDFREAARIT